MYTVHPHILRFLKSPGIRGQSEMVPYYRQISVYGKQSLKFRSSVYSGAEYNILGEKSTGIFEKRRFTQVCTDDGIRFGPVNLWFRFFISGFFLKGDVTLHPYRKKSGDLTRHQIAGAQRAKCGLVLCFI